VKVKSFIILIPDRAHSSAKKIGLQIELRQFRQCSVKIYTNQCSS